MLEFIHNRVSIIKLVFTFISTKIEYVLNNS